MSSFKRGMLAESIYARAGLVKRLAEQEAALVEQEGLMFEQLYAAAPTEFSDWLRSHKVLEMVLAQGLFEHYWPAAEYSDQQFDFLKRNFDILHTVWSGVVTLEYSCFNEIIALRVAMVMGWPA
jgi:hypothetical protein